LFVAADLCSTKNKKMKIIVTGSLGNISKPLAKTLVQQGHAVTVISSDPQKQKDIEALGATAAIGSVEDAAFLAATFSGADAVYCMVPPNYYHAAEVDPIAHFRRVGSSYAQAIRQSGVKRVVHLSSFGAHLDKGTGVILGAHYVEQLLNELPDVAITHMRPTYFYYNLYAFVNMIKEGGVIAANYGGEDKIILVSPIDIAAAVAEEIVLTVDVKPVRYVASDEHSASEIAQVLGAAIGRPDLKWVTISDEDTQRGLEASGMPQRLAALLVEMYACHHSGKLAEDYYKNKPQVMGQVKLTDFAREFAAAFKQN
jgi:uncharacterized protein YbjT (DUF2867 family)